MTKHIQNSRHLRLTQEEYTYLTSEDRGDAERIVVVREDGTAYVAKDRAGNLVLSPEEGRRD